jgi:TonB family protein
MRILVFAVCLIALPAFATESAQAAERSLVASQSPISESRTLDDVQLVINNNKKALYVPFARAVRDKPGMQGKLLLSFSIAPDGTVTKCTIVSSTFNDPEFEKSIIERFSAINFGPKGTKTYIDPEYPIEFRAL